MMPNFRLKGLSIEKLWGGASEGTAVPSHVALHLFLEESLR